ncbi:MAG: Cytochrome c oxidase polypeptide [Myxococcales bacterium]|nr:Cytochrome c oxidase polypeptide [Myxococcales bacterium]
MNEGFRIGLYLPPQASTIARRIDVLHYTVIGAAFLVAFLAFFMIGIFLIRYRERPGHEAPHGHIPVRAEITLAVFTLLVFLVWWGIGFTQFRDIRTTPPGAIRVHVVAKQWMWQFVYPNGMNSEDELRIPVGQPVEVLLTSRDVIHSFFVPAFRVKQDVLPGRVTSLWFTAVNAGTYDIFCAEFCGTGHSRMRGRVIAMRPDDYARWISGQRTTPLATVGERLSASFGCLRCHTIDGTPHLGPSWLGLYGSKIPLSNGQFVVADDAYLTESMMDPAVKLHAGYPALMPSYLGQLSGPEAGAIVEFIRSLRRHP